MLVERPGLSPVMVGRGAELDRLARLVDLGPAPAVALIGGEAGIGKTRLISELCSRLPADTQVLAGQADPGALGRPFELLLDALDSSRGFTDERLALLTDRSRTSEERVAVGLDVVRDRTRLAPTVIVFDDLHWADSESVILFERLAEPGSGPVLLVGTYRPDGLSRRHPTSELIPRLERRHAITHVHLDRLTPDDVSSFLTAIYGRPPSFRVVETLHARTGGNPFFLEELLAAAGEADPDELVRQPLPWSLAEVMRAQLDDLEPKHRSVLETAAVLGRRVTFDLLASVSGFDEDELIPILRALVAAGLLVEAESDVFSFRHALAREAIENDLLGRERRRLHQAALDALRAAGSDDVIAIAHHADGAGRYGEMVTAAREGAERSLDEGATYQALQLAELGLTEACDDTHLLGLAARAAWLAGLVDDAVNHARRWLEIGRAKGDVVVQVAALRRLIRLRWEAGDVDGTIAATDEVIALLDQMEDGSGKGNAIASVAQGYMLRDDIPKAIEWGDKGIEYGEKIGDERVVVWSKAEKGSALMTLPELASTGSALLRQVADDAERLGEWIIVARALNNRVRADLYRPDPEDARVSLTRMQRAAERAGFDSLANAGYWHALAELAEWEGDISTALSSFDEAGRRDRSANASKKTPWYVVHEAGLALEAGDVERATAIYDRSAPPPGVQNRPWRWGLGLHLASRRGDLTEARVQLAGLIDALALTAGAEPQMVHDVVHAMLAARMPVSEVRSFVERIELGDERPLEPDSPWRSLIEAQLLEAEQQIAASYAAYKRAAEGGSGVLRPPPLGTAATGAARTAIALDQLDDAKAHAAAAAQLLSRWSGWRVEELGAVERRLGGGVEADGPASLTPREREVVALLADGLSNGEIASKLYISPKTASVHVSNILAKLGMANRAEITAFAVREGLAAP
jgi:DNA-binding CsgD family transcriptional regulator